MDLSTQAGVGGVCGLADSQLILLIVFRPILAIKCHDHYVGFLKQKNAADSWQWSSRVWPQIPFYELKGQNVP